MREKSKDPVEILMGSAAGFLDFARNDNAFHDLPCSKLSEDRKFVK